MKGFAIRYACLVVLFFLFFLSVPAGGIGSGFEGGLDGFAFGGIGKKESVRSMAVELLSVGIEEYNRALFGSAEKILLRAQEHKRYLSGEERSRLSKYLKRAAEAAVRRESAVEHIRSADELVREGKLIRAKAHLREVNGSELLTAREKQFVRDGLGKVEKWLAQEQGQIRELYERSIELFNFGQLENARAGFIRVARSGLLVVPDGQMAEDYIHKIDLLIGETVSAFTITDIELFERKARVQAGVDGSEGLLGRRERGLGVVRRPEDIYVEAISRKRNLVLGYTRAIVDDSVKKARDYINVGKFYQAQKEVDTTRKVLEENRLYIEDNIFRQYSSQLESLEVEIVEGREKWLGGFRGDSSVER